MAEADKTAARPSATEAAATKQSAWTPNVNIGLWGNTYYLDNLPPRPLLIQDLRKMVRSDETASAMMYCINTAIGSMPWRHVGMVNGVLDEKDPSAIEAAHFADTLIQDMRRSWRSFLIQAMSIVWSGLAPFEVVMKRRTADQSKFPDNAWGVDRLVPIDPLTVLSWEQIEKTDILTGMRQMAAPQPLPLWKILHIRNQGYMDDPWGEPLLTGAWKAWKLKTRIQDIEALGIERELVGLPVFRVPEDVLLSASEVDDSGAPTQNALRAQAVISQAKKAVSQTRLGPTDGLVLPSNTWSEDEQVADRTPKYDFKLVTTGGPRSIDTRTPARDHDRAIMRVCLMQFLALGERAGGSYGLSDDQSSIAMSAIAALAGVPADEWNLKVLPLVWTLSGKDPRYMPRLRPGDVGKEGLTAVGAFLRGVGAVQALWDQDEKARGSILRAAGLEFDRTVQTGAAGTAGETSQATLDKLKEPTPAPVAAPRAANANKNIAGAADEDDEDEA